MTKTIESITGLEAPESIDELLENFKRGEPPRGEKLKFEGVVDKDVYNTTAAFEYNGKKYLIGRVESLPGVEEVHDLPADEMYKIRVDFRPPQ